MKHLTRWILALVAVATVASFSGAWTIQERPKATAGIERVYESRKPKKMSRSIKHAAVLRALPTFKLTLIEAIQLAEKEVGGKAVYADIEVKEGKPMIKVNLFVADKFTPTRVDPMTKKVMIYRKGGASNEDEDEEEEEADEGGEDEEGG